MPDAARRLLLLAPFAAVAGCAGAPPPPPVEGPPIGYAYLPPLRLDVASVEFDDRLPLTGPRDMGRELSPTPAEAVRTMGRDRLAALGAGNVARFSVTQASIVPERLPAQGGMFARDPGERLTGTLGCRLEILDANGRRLAFCEAQTVRTRPSDSNPVARRRAAESLLRLAAFDLNTEFEFQLRRALRPYLVEGERAAPALPAPVEREALPPA